MKAKIFIAIFSLIIGYSSFAQHSFNPFNLTNVEWVLGGSAGQPPTISSNYFYKICGDTLFRDTLYKKMYYATYNYPYQPPPGYVYPVPNYYLSGFFRQDSVTKSDYYMPLSDSISRLWYCYNLHIGDTLKTTTGINILCNGHTKLFNMGTNHAAVVRKTDSISIGNKKFKIYVTDTTESSIFYNQQKGMFLIEGLGHCYGILNAYQPSFEGTPTLNYIMFDTVCNAKTLLIEKFRQENTLTISPNPNNGIFTVELNNEELQILHISDVNGTVVFNQSLKGRSQIDANNLSDGVFNLSLISSNGVLNRRLVIVR